MFKTLLFTDKDNMTQGIVVLFRNNEKDSWGISRHASEGNTYHTCYQLREGWGWQILLEKEDMTVHEAIDLL